MEELIHSSGPKDDSKKPASTVVTIDGGLSTVSKKPRVESPPEKTSDVPLKWMPIFTHGVFQDSCMSTKMFANVCLPSGVTPEDTSIYLDPEDHSTLIIDCKMPDILSNSVKLVKDCFKSGGRAMSKREMQASLRVTALNNALSEMGADMRTSVWFRSRIQLKEPASSTKFLRKIFKRCEKTRALVVCVDMMVHESAFLKNKNMIEILTSDSSDDESDDEIPPSSPFYN